jgi:hypothetical protein
MELVSEITNKNKKIFFFFKGAGCPLGSKRVEGHPLVAEGCGALLKMPSRSTMVLAQGKNTGKSH